MTPASIAILLIAVAATGFVVGKIIRRVWIRREV